MSALERRKDRLASTFDVGVEPPIEADGRRHTPLDRRRVSLRWLTGTVLTGLSGAALIGAAVFSALDRKSNFAEAPELANLTRKDATTSASVNPKKGDRLVKAVDIVAARQAFRAPTTIKVGDKEVIKVRGFTRVATTLTLASTGFADEVPPFNPLKVVADARNPVDQPTDPGPVQDDAEVSFVTSDLSGLTKTPTAGSLSIDEIQAQVTEHVQNALAAGKKPALPLPPQLLLMRTSRASLDPTGGLSYATPGNSAMSAPFSTIEVRMVPENVTLIQKSGRGPQANPPVSQMEERLVVVRHGDTLEDILKANGATRDQIKSMVSSFAAKRGEAPIAEGERLKLLLADLDGSGQPMQICRISVYNDETVRTTIAVTDSGEYLKVAKVDPPPKPAQRSASDDSEVDDNPGGLRLYDSLYETALKQDIPRPIIDDLVRIFANDVDFQRSVSGGDSFEAFYIEGDEGDSRLELLFASVATRGETFRYYRFQTPDDSLVDFYDPNGRSVRKFLLRKPIAAGELRSGFGMRYHPILRYSKMHTGVDWANATGTPILAAGNGTVIKAAWDSGYGRRVEIQHANGYITTYNHMSGFARGITEGVKVRQGQVVGYLGSTGLATGPHLHYEVMVNGRFVDPLQIRLPRTREFDGRLLADFKRERDRIDGLMAKAPNATAERVAAKPPG